MITLIHENQESKTTIDLKEHLNLTEVLSTFKNFLLISGYVTDYEQLSEYYNDLHCRENGL